jgi:hypothetical protein
VKDPKTKLDRSINLQAVRIEFVVRLPEEAGGPSQKIPIKMAVG